MSQITLAAGIENLNDSKFAREVAALQEAAIALWKEEESSADRLGAALLAVRDRMRHGEFIKWMNSTGLDTNHAYYASGRAAFLRYHCNLWVTFRQGRSIPTDKWEACKGPACWEGMSALEMRRKFLEENASTPCWTGLDLGEISDLTCFACIWPRCTINGEDHELMTIVPFFWIPEFGLLEKERQWGVPLSEWTRAGFMKLSEAALGTILCIQMVVFWT